MIESRAYLEHGELKPNNNAELTPKAQREFETLKEELKASGYPLWEIGSMTNPTKLFMMKNDLYRFASKFRRENNESELGFEFVKGYMEQINNRLVELDK